MNTRWKEAVLAALKRYYNRHHTRNITRQGFIKEELDRIMEETNTTARRPDGSLNETLVKLRDAGKIEFSERGNYILLDPPIKWYEEDFPDEINEAAIKGGKLSFENIPTSDEQVFARHRKGQELIRKLVLSYYHSQCALCDVTDEKLLVASHIVRWADAPEFRGNLSNVICLCKFHDALFEAGYISFDDDLRVLKKNVTDCKSIQINQDTAKKFRLPDEYRPSARFLLEHRQRVGFETME